MSRVLLVSNGHGEHAVAARIAAELQQAEPQIVCDHFALVGGFSGSGTMHEVGPRAVMPSGGLVAMGNVVNLARDVRAGLLRLTFAQLRWLRSVRGVYPTAVAVGDSFALWMTLRAAARATIFVGTAKSVHVAPYGPMEERVLRQAGAVFVRDTATAALLQRHGIAATAANVIADLHPVLEVQPVFAVQLALFPGSRETAYDDAVFLCGLVEQLARTDSNAGALLSIAPNLRTQRFVETLRSSGFCVEERSDPLHPFSIVEHGREIVRATREQIGALLAGTQVVLGQAGTANEAAAAAGIPVVAFAAPRERRTQWYRRRQLALLGDAMVLVERSAAAGAAAAAALVRDPRRRAAMAHSGRLRMRAGSVRDIAAAVVSLYRETA
ncbi:MAG: hypothetical protein JOZ01_06025 [Candidatus Eremiobacteraeota bacterium]|nr:hypothetical protein [Candidatus Eremiobacteraeota bacterium]